MSNCERIPILFIIPLSSYFRHCCEVLGPSVVFSKKIQQLLKCRSEQLSEILQKENTMNKSFIWVTPMIDISQSKGLIPSTMEQSRHDLDLTFLHRKSPQRSCLKRISCLQRFSFVPVSNSTFTWTVGHPRPK